ncbi:MAG: hypothetical protein COX02_01825 [Candidatus Vogelbacteria bacterium CG22_combo_CG10-13_8_21_14_all_37_9]|uniref:Methyltransferase domain-containing protein n=1 Tax=Candidatus Vogelbacteria bacterium CG22_combo_CG10-13_8_21_14_all_37_9 TaxID=1975046 RepID=A0A2H0BKF8_9BACT|nr:MAG: hypothetical protein BK005_02035 [bacterium CG10_37_50]PIP58163.1 MAG: hypothetical protein COX02_01825 [Candidatus Vogelbacteria bacterium CG22_combo_CG10-13_8_21_14_all_37_9]
MILSKIITDLFKRLVNFPPVWNTLQYLVGANNFKYQMYPSVFSAKNGRLLDFGCSCGNSTSVFLDFDYTGIDIDPEAIEAAKRKFKNYPQIKFLVADLITGPFQTNFFDHILFAGTAHHLKTAELELITKNLFLSLKPGGEFHFFDPIIQNDKDNLITKLFLRFDQGKNMRSREVLEQFFRSNGYDIIETKIFKSPNRLIKLPDFLYLKINKKRDD